MKKMVTILFTIVFTLNFVNTKTYANVDPQSTHLPKLEKSTVKGSFVVTSDPQYPWTDITDNSDPNVTETESEKKRRSEEFIRGQYNSINEYIQQLKGMTEATPVLINGDVTAFGHPWQWNKMESLLNILKAPILLGLGNHDIENNIDDCVANSCVRSSMEHYTDRIQLLAKTRYDRKGEYPNNSHKFGSFAYSVDVGPIHFVQLNNYPTMTFQVSGYTMEDSLNWLEQDLKDAYQYGQASIVNMHEPSGWKKGTQEQKDRFKGLLKKYNVKAVFAGHYHKKSGYFPNDYKEYFGDVPVFLSGSASQKTYLIAEYDNNEMKVYKVRNNEWKNKKLVGKINISGRPFPSYSKVVKLYEHANGLGRDLKGLTFSEWNDKISSVRLPPFTQIELFEHIHYKGQKKVLRNYGNLPKLYNLYDFNDITSSYRISEL
ncbi:metallophosphoesterase [Bacillus thuringiensis]|uniref:metallophosphoesterase n=1 Tax=Bacillus thuringiensis TaxID=1428 RepID=UPI000BF6091E|nr:metallophosphoesterase [Bacillus thuringiensis]PFN52282.1 hypothetical protein COJ75_24025 [Bacillus thuringiensis]